MSRWVNDHLFFASGDSSLKYIMNNVNTGMWTSLKEVSIMTAAEYGLEVTSFMMAQQNNLMKIVDSQFLIYQTVPHNRQRTDYSHLTLITSTDPLLPYTPHGKLRKMLSLHIATHTLASCGILHGIWSISQMRRKQSIVEQCKNGKIVLYIFFSTYKNFTASFSMCLWFTLEAMRISQASRLCCMFVISILSYLIGQLKASQRRHALVDRHLTDYLSWLHHSQATHLTQPSSILRCKLGHWNRSHHWRQVEGMEAVFWVGHPRWTERHQLGQSNQFLTSHLICCCFG